MGSAFKAKKGGWKLNDFLKKKKLRMLTLFVCLFLIYDVISFILLLFSIKYYMRIFFLFQFFWSFYFKVFYLWRM